MKWFGFRVLSFCSFQNSESMQKPEKVEKTGREMFRIPSSEFLQLSELGIDAHKARWLGFFPGFVVFSEIRIVHIRTDLKLL